MTDETHDLCGAWARHNLNEKNKNTHWMLAYWSYSWWTKKHRLKRLNRDEFRECLHTFGWVLYKNFYVSVKPCQLERIRSLKPCSICGAEPDEDVPIHISERNC